MAAGGHGPELQDANIDLKDKASLQRGAKYFANYCMGCHSLQYMRYNRMAADLDIPEDELTENLIFGDAKPGDLMTNAMRPEDGTEVVRHRGPGPDAGDALAQPGLGLHLPQVLLRR
jgi:ubiquinol-cytochrome c reductase cytochrome c1 subunit